MSNRISIEPAFEAAEVELLGYVFPTKPQTKVALEKYEKWEEKYEALPDDAEVESVEVLAEMYDLVLDMGTPEEGGGNKAKPSTVIKKAWNANKVEPRALLVGLGQIAEAGRPT